MLLPGSPPCPEAPTGLMGTAGHVGEGREVGMEGSPLWISPNPVSPHQEQQNHYFRGRYIWDGGEEKKLMPRTNEHFRSRGHRALRQTVKANCLRNTPMRFPHMGMEIQVQRFLHWELGTLPFHREKATEIAPWPHDDQPDQPSTNTYPDKKLFIWISAGS